MRSAHLPNPPPLDFGASIKIGFSIFFIQPNLKNHVNLRRRRIRRIRILEKLFFGKDLAAYGKKSTHKLYDIFLVDEQELRAEASNVEPEYEIEIESVMESYKSLYSKWVFELRSVINPFSIITEVIFRALYPVLTATVTVVGHPNNDKSSVVVPTVYNIK